jgi:tetratricopeptide (TPR) repeat protein
MRRILALVLLILAAPTLPLAQTRRQQTGPDLTKMSVHVVDENHRPVRGAMVQLLSGFGNVIFQTFTNEQGFADLTGVTQGRYKVRARGDDIEETTGQEFVIFAGQGYYDVMLTVNRKREAARTSLNSMVDVADLKVPDKARAEFDKGTEALNRNELAKAREYFEKAIRAYPEYSAAYNNLGIAWLREGRAEEGGAALRKAVSLNPHLTSAYRNLATLEYSQRRFAEAEDLLSRSLRDNPDDPEGLTLLAKVQVVGGRMDQAIATARKVHALPHQNYGVVHYLAAIAYRAKGQDQDAVEQYNLFLKEAPNHENVPYARDALKTLKAQSN